MLMLNEIEIAIEDRVVCSQLSATMHIGETWGILGANGSGKTTLLHALAGLHNISHGKIIYYEKNLSEYSTRHLAQHRGLLLQDTACDFPATVYDTVALGRYPQQNYWGRVTDADRHIIQQTLETFDLVQLRHQCITKLSGGEKRRVALAMLAVQEPDIYLLDEPTNHLDIRHQLHMLNYFNQQQKLVILSLHDVNLAKQYCTHIILLRCGQYRLGTTLEILTPENLTWVFDYPFRELAAGFLLPKAN